MYSPFVSDALADERGYFKETFSDKYAALGLSDVFVQDNVSRSSRGVLRGMHYDFGLSKLVQCLVGSIYDVIVDVREESPTYLEWEGFELSEENHRQLYVPRGFAHGFLAVSDEVVVRRTNRANTTIAAHERGLAWDDPAIGIRWPLAGDMLLSRKIGPGRTLERHKIYEA